MSNLIKYPFVNLEGKETIVINNNNPQEDKFIPFQDKRVQIRTISEIEAEKALLRATGAALPEEDMEEGDESGEFKAGLNVTNFDKMFQEQQKQAADKAEKVLEEARDEAERIKTEASIAAEAARNHGYEEGKEQGYQEGLMRAEQEIQAKEQELAESARQQREELLECIAGVEEKYVNVLVALIRKLTGVVIEGRDDLILYLIRTAVNDLEPSDNYRIRVSSEDVYFLESRKSEILDSLGEDIMLEFVEEKGLEKTQCIIETDTQMIDCGFQTQVDTLIRDLKMLVR